MSRIFAHLSVVVSLALLVCLLHGYWMGDYHAAWNAVRAAQATDRRNQHESTESPTTSDTEVQATRDSFFAMQRQVRWHTMLGLFSSLAGVFIQSLVITYFIGTSRWCKEVVQAYGLSTEHLSASQALKRRSFPWSLLGITSLIVVASTGAAADPGTLMPSTERWVIPHSLTAIVGFGLTAWAMLRQFHFLRANESIVNEITSEVAGIRAERGLPVEQG